MEWSELRQKIWRNETIDLSPHELAVKLMESYEKIEDLEDRLKKVEDKQDAKE